MDAFDIRCDLAADAASRTMKFASLSKPLHQVAYRLLQALEKRPINYYDIRQQLADIDLRLLQLYRPGTTTPQTHDKLPEPLRACFLGLRRTVVESSCAKWSIQKLNEAEQWHMKKHHRELVAVKNMLTEEHLDLLEKRIAAGGQVNAENDGRIAECYQHIFEGFFFTEGDREYHRTQIALIQQRQVIDQEIRNHIAVLHIAQKGQRNQDAQWISEFFTIVEEQRAQLEAVDMQKRHAEAEEQQRLLTDLENRIRQTFEKTKAAVPLRALGSGYATPTTEEATPKSSGGTVANNTNVLLIERFNWADPMNKAAAAAQSTVPAQAQPGPRAFNRDTERIPLPPDYCPPATALPRPRWAWTPSKFNRCLFDIENDTYFRAIHSSTIAQAQEEFYNQLLRNGEVASCVLWLIEERLGRDGGLGEGDRVQTAQMMAAELAEREQTRRQELFAQVNNHHGQQIAVPFISVPTISVTAHTSGKLALLQDLSNRASVRRSSSEPDAVQNQRNISQQPETEPEPIEKVHLGRPFGLRPINEGPPPGMTIARFEHYLAKHQRRKNNRRVSAIHNSIDANMPAHDQARMPVGYQGRPQRGEIKQHRGLSLESDLTYAAFEAEQLEQKRIVDEVKKEQTARMQKSEKRRWKKTKSASPANEVEDKRLADTSRLLVLERGREEATMVQREEQARLKQVEGDRVAAVAKKEKEDREEQELRRRQAEEVRLEAERQQRQKDQLIVAAVEAQRVANAMVQQARLKQLEDDRLTVIAQKKKKEDTEAETLRRKQAEEKIESDRLAAIANAKAEARKTAKLRERKERESVAAQEFRLNCIADEKETATLAANTRIEHEERLRRSEEERVARERSRPEQAAERLRLQDIEDTRIAKELEQRCLVEGLFELKRIADKRQKEEAMRLLQKMDTKSTGSMPATITRDGNITAARNLRPAGAGGAVVDLPTMAQVDQLVPKKGKALESDAQTPMKGPRYLGDICNGTVVPVEGAMTPATEKILKLAVAKDPQLFSLAASKFALPLQEPKAPAEDEVTTLYVTRKGKAKDGLDPSRWASSHHVFTATPAAPSGPAQMQANVPLLMRRLFEQMVSEGRLDSRYVAAFRASWHDEGASLRALSASAHPPLVLRNQFKKAYSQDVERMRWSSELPQTQRPPIASLKPAKKVAPKQRVDANYDAITRRVKELTAIEEVRKAGTLKAAELPIPDDYFASENVLHARMGFPVSRTDEWEGITDSLLDMAIARAKLDNEYPPVPLRMGTERRYFSTDEEVQEIARRNSRAAALRETVGGTNVAAFGLETFVQKIANLSGRVVSRSVVSTTRVGETNIAASGSNRSLGSGGQLKYQTKEELEMVVQEGNKKAQMAELKALDQQGRDALEMEAVLAK